MKLYIREQHFKEYKRAVLDWKDSFDIEIKEPMDKLIIK